MPSSFSRTASSTAISSNGFIDILTLAVSTPLPSGLDAHLDVEVDDALDRDQDFHVKTRLGKLTKFYRSLSETRRLNCSRLPGAGETVARY